ncbi:MAG TPA: RelA/SpoT family protein [Bacteroidales bacterium]|nr:bifunctional (p)ppGpp synthetase/guanosine-3',5'-bis(diphosphate) 3'-pyrophosphohydrolase [Bacteroidales bacterium]MCZ2416353.1 RelA/SpoT family protein [Burkholderiales bacterium]OQC58747.1 MAG: GTP pyrophosphokinase [Bacteroidetes bacterium ADurb.Bin013]MBV6455807.1 GTP pyrophosphokinase [Bacteroidales bacterium]MCZ2316093.1 RelA/SpoT family protein [Bacteroidales bacterium]
MNQTMIDKAKEYAAARLEGLKRGNGAPFMQHVDAVAAIVEKEIGLAGEAVATVYLHEASRKHPELLAEIASLFGHETGSMVVGLNKISTINPRDTRLQAENYRKLIISYSADPRVTLIKLADRLEVMRSLADCFPRNDHIKKATETMMLYAPLAHQLGLYRIKSELEDLSFKVIQPEDYRLITNNLRANEIERKKQIAGFVQPLEKELRKAGIRYELKSRTKTTYSIWRKMQIQQVGVDEVYDILAIRFIVDTTPDREKEVCWQVYSIVTQIYEPIPERMRDWITVPKASGYESLHITVRTPEGAALEVQIRSRRMDIVAEFGVAAHWAYKGVKNEQVMNDWLAGVRKRLQNPQEDFSSAEKDLYKSNEIYVFTPAGDLRRLPAGATVLDFAFEIHSNIGLRCTGGRVNGKMSQVRDTLQTGDVVEILTSRNQKPSRDWLGFVVSGKARNKIRQKLREEEGIQDVAGREMLERRLKNWKMELTPEDLMQLMKHFRIKQISDFYAAVAREDISLQDIKLFLLKDKEDTSEKPETGSTPPEHAEEKTSYREGDYLVIDDNFGRIGYKLARCCNPVIGDEVFGFVSIKEGIKIHRMSCPNAARLMTRYPYRIQKVRWREKVTSAMFQITIRFTAYQEIGLAQEISDVIGNLSLNLRSFTFSGQGGKIAGKLQVAVSSNKQVDLLLFQLRKIRGITKAVRE